LRLGTLVPMNIEVLTKYPLSQDRIVFEIRLHSKSLMPYRPALHGNWNALSLARRALKNKLPKPTLPPTTVLQNCQLFVPDLVLTVGVCSWRTTWCMLHNSVPAATREDREVLWDLTVGRTGTYFKCCGVIIFILWLFGFFYYVTFNVKQDLQINKEW
jgi:hypothetical protein